MVDVVSRIAEHVHSAPGSCTEDALTSAVESQTARVPSIAYLGLAVGCMGVSFLLQQSTNPRTKMISNFIGQWAPTILIMGLYNKLVKVHGHDQEHTHSASSRSSGSKFGSDSSPGSSGF